MGIEQFAPSRDFLYFAALLFGVGGGCILNRFRRKSSARFKNLAITIGLCFFSGALAALTVSVIYSNGMIFAENSLYLPAGILTVLVALAVRFPRVAGFPLILVSGIFVVWMGYASLRFPVFDGSGGGQVTRDGSGLVQVRLFPPSGTGPDTFFSYQPAGQDAVLEFRALNFTLPATFPFSGGASRGFIAEIKSDDETLYKDPRLGKLLFPGQYPWPGANDRHQQAWQRFFSLREIFKKLEVKTLLPGMSLTFLLDKP